MSLWRHSNYMSLLPQNVTVEAFRLQVIITTEYVTVQAFKLHVIITTECHRGGIQTTSHNYHRNALLKDNLRPLDYVSDAVPTGKCWTNHGPFIRRHFSYVGTTFKRLFVSSWPTTINPLTPKGFCRYCLKCE
ncbi:hypothetical protein CHS0354_029192 [Potamilus streckersoni]|uniref:Uncharacterized protein n=1 Tax=Potamilus streckersoni TaxID=2493646 RepID=A0AAE0TG61_9BIVA|nr:hypothetical protein CHS0354_029192 [Potamilus streckersoni]